MAICAAISSCFFFCVFMAQGVKTSFDTLSFYGNKRLRISGFFGRLNLSENMESVMHIRHFATNSICYVKKMRGRRAECHLWDCISVKIQKIKKN